MATLHEIGAALPNVISKSCAIIVRVDTPRQVAGMPRPYPLSERRDRSSYGHRPGGGLSKGESRSLLTDVNPRNEEVRSSKAWG